MPNTQIVVRDEAHKQPLLKTVYYRDDDRYGDSDYDRSYASTYTSHDFRGDSGYPSYSDANLLNPVFLLEACVGIILVWALWERAFKRKTNDRIGRKPRFYVGEWPPNGGR